jgi:hypothetical protein
MMPSARRRFLEERMIQIQTTQTDPKIVILEHGQVRRYRDLLVPLTNDLDALLLEQVNGLTQAHVFERGIHS